MVKVRSQVNQRSGGMDLKVRRGKANSKKGETKDPTGTLWRKKE